MLILSRVCADFHDSTGRLIHRVTARNRLTFHEAPEAIREDPLFQMLVNEGSLEAALTPARKRKLESDPLDGADAAGRKLTAESQAASSSKASVKRASHAGQSGETQETATQETMKE